MHVTPLDESQFVSISYEYSHTTYVPVSCDYYDSFDYNVDTCPLLGRSKRLEALTVFNRELYLHSLLNTNFTLASSTPEAMSCDDFDVRSKAPIPLGNDFCDDAHGDQLEEANDFSSPLAVAPFLEFSTAIDHPRVV